MDADQRSESLRDTIGLDVERALAVDIAPGLPTQVRSRIARERASAARRKRQVVPLGVAALAAAAFLIAIRVQPEGEPASALREPHAISASAPAVVAIDAERPIPEATRAGQPARPAANRGEGVRPVDRRATQAHVLMPDERTALALLLANIREGRIDPAEPEARSLHAPLEPLDEIAIEPIVIRPLARLEFVQGERQ